jgi:hypothetical protein
MVAASGATLVIDDAMIAQQRAVWRSKWRIAIVLIACAVQHFSVRIGLLNRPSAGTHDRAIVAMHLRLHSRASRRPVCRFFKKAQATQPTQQWICVTLLNA